jgi:hypothetical protein
MTILWYIRMYRRANARWTVNECLRLEREFDLLELSIQEIAELHERSPSAIMYKLDAEGLADFNELYLNSYKNLTVDVNDDYESESETSEYDEDYTEDINHDASDGEDVNDSEEEDDEEYDRYNMKQQVKLLTKQLANLTAIVYNAFATKNKSGGINYSNLAGC